MKSIQNSPENLLKEPVNSKLPFGWKHLLVRFFAVLVVSGIFSYMQISGIMSVKSLEARLLVPAACGLVLAVLNWNYLVKIGLVLLPIWFAASTAIAFAGVILVGMLEMPYDQGTYWWLDLLIEYIPAVAAGHWLYSGYSRMSKGISFYAWLIAVTTSVLTVFLLYRADVSFAILQAFYYPILCAGLSLVHFKKEKSKSIFI